MLRLAKKIQNVSLVSCLLALDAHTILYHTIILSYILLYIFVDHSIWLHFLIVVHPCISYMCSVFTWFWLVTRHRGSCAESEDERGDASEAENDDRRGDLTFHGDGQSRGRPTENQFLFKVGRGLGL